MGHGCFPTGKREQICGKHAQESERDLFLVKYGVEIEGRAHVVQHKQLFLKAPMENVVLGVTVDVD